MYILTVILLLFNSFLYGQGELTTILQTSINLKQLVDHIEKNDIVDERQIKHIKADSRIPTDTELSYQDKDLEYNDGNNNIGFMNHWSFEFNEISVKKNRAFVSYKFIPHWKNCSGQIQTMQSGTLYFEIKVDLQKIQGQWEIKGHEIKDVDIEDAEIEKCVKDSYIRM